MIKYTVGWILIWASCGSFAADLREIELRRLLEPTESELHAESQGRIYIYDGLRDVDVELAMERQFDRIENMMFIRVKPTDEDGEVLLDPKTGEDLVPDDGC